MHRRLAALLILICGFLVVGCDSSESSEPPWGLTEIDMPDTEAEVIAVLEAMPPIDDRQPTVLVDEVAMFYEGTPDEPPGVYRSVTVLPADEPPSPGEFVGLIEEVIADADADEGVTVEASAIDPAEPLIWVVIDDAETDDGIPAYYMAWADPEGSWFFQAIGDTSEFRQSLIEAFVDAAGGS